MLKALFDPRLFNVLMLVLSALACVRWGIEGKWASCGYWFFAAGITYVVTYGFKN